MIYMFRIMHVYVCGSVVLRVSPNLQTGRCVPVGGFQEAAQRRLPVGTLTEAEAELGVTKAPWEHSRVMVTMGTRYLASLQPAYIYIILFFLVCTDMAGKNIGFFMHWFIEILGYSG